ncbi:MAG: coiled-coil domain-containing protein [Nanoarchaeota archaeon]
MNKENHNKTKVFYIKDNIVYNSNTKKYFFPQNLKDIEIPNHTKNHLTNNKIIISDLNKLKQKKNREINLSKPIKNFTQVKLKINQLNKKNFIKPKDQDYTFIEITSQLDIINGIINNIETDDIDLFNTKINNYIKNIEHIEKEKNSNIEEQIEIENNKLKKTNTKKNNFITKNITNLKKQLNKIKEENQKLENQKEELIVKQEENNINKQLQTKIEKINNKILKIQHTKKNNEFEIKILKSKIKTINDYKKLGNKKCLNILLMIFTLGLIYWTRFSDCNYKILKFQKTINQLEESNNKLDKKQYNYQQELENLQHHNKNDSIKKTKIIEELNTKIDNIEEQINKNNNEIKNKENEITNNKKQIDEYDKNIKKINTKLIELKATKKEFNDYNSNKIKKLKEEIINDKQNKINSIKELKNTITSQKIKIKGEWIISINI